MSGSFMRFAFGSVFALTPWHSMHCMAQEQKTNPIGTTQEMDEDPFLSSWFFGWASGLLPVPAEDIDELGLSDSQKMQIRRILERVQMNSLTGTSAKAELNQSWNSDQTAVLERLHPTPLKKKATLNWGAGEALALSPDGKILVIGLPRGAVKLWNVANQQDLVTLQDSGVQVDFVDFSLDGKTIAGRGIRSDVAVWDVNTGRLQTVLKTGIKAIDEYDPLQRGAADADGPRYLAFSSEGKSLATVSRSGKVRVWDVVTGEEVKLRPGDPGALPVSLDRNFLAFASDGKTVATVQVDVGGPEIAIRDAVTWKENVRFHTDLPPYVPLIAYRPDGKTLAVAASQSYVGVKLWDVATGGLQASFTQPLGSQSVTSIAFSPDGTLLAFVAGQKSGIWDLKHGRLWKKFPDGSSSRSDSGSKLAFTADGKTLVVAGTKELVRQEVQAVIDRENGTLAPEAPEVLVLWDVPARTADEPRTVSPGKQAKRKPERSETNGEPYIPNIVPGRVGDTGVLQKSPDGRLTVVVDAAACWMSDAATGLRVGTALNHGKKSKETMTPMRVTCWAFSPDGKLLATGAGYSNMAGYSEGVVSVWEVTSGKLVASASGRITNIKAVSFSKDSKTVYFEAPGRYVENRT